MAGMNAAGRPLVGALVDDAWNALGRAAGVLDEGAATRTLGQLLDDVTPLLDDAGRSMRELGTATAAVDAAAGPVGRLQAAVDDAARSVTGLLRTGTARAADDAAATLRDVRPASARDAVDLLDALHFPG